MNALQLACVNEGHWVQDEKRAMSFCGKAVQPKKIAFS